MLDSFGRVPESGVQQGGASFEAAAVPLARHCDVRIWRYAAELRSRGGQLALTEEWDGNIRKHQPPNGR
jgi:hypothetical protein